MDSRNNSLICVLILFCMMICFLEQKIYENSSNAQIAGFSVNSELFRGMDLSGIDLDYVHEKAKEWNLDYNRILTVLLVYQFPFHCNDYLNENQIIYKSNELIRKYPKVYEETYEAVQAVFGGITYFPVPVLCDGNDTLWVEYVNSWGVERTYGGTRTHEGTDLMAERNESGVYPVLAITDGTIEKMGWLEKGGWRIGIRSNDGGYFYYAHLSDYADVREGDTVRAGQIIGFMGDTGYGVTEGTRGMFDVHLHLGIYLDADGEEISINPYWILRYLEKNVLAYNISQKARR